MTNSALLKVAAGNSILMPACGDDLGDALGAICDGAKGVPDTVGWGECSALTCAVGVEDVAEGDGRADLGV